MKKLFVSLLSLFACLVRVAAAAPSPSPSPQPRPSVIYVRDFDIEVRNVSSSGGLLQNRPRLFGRRNEANNPEAQAHQLVELMATSLVRDLKKAGYTAVRLPAGQARPTQGGLIRGVFVNVDEGNRLRRAVIGFGNGQTDLQVIASYADLTAGPPQPLYQIDTSAHSNKMPGAVITMNPYVAAAKFLMAGHDMQRNVEQTASKIAARVNSYFQPAAPAK